MRILVGDIFDGTRLWQDHALVTDGGILHAILPKAEAPAGGEPIKGLILPGFIDLQVNGGGGILFNQDTTVAGLRQMAKAHRSTGTLGLLPTLITDEPSRVTMAIAAVAEAIAHGVPGILGLHLEGPHLSIARKGAHDPSLIREMTKADEAELIAAARQLPNLMVTIAPETVPLPQAQRLTEAGVILSLGHTDCDYDCASRYFAAGVSCATHLFNAMSPLGNRAPGLVGAVLDRPEISAGLIADGIHVHPAAMRLALAAPKAEGALYLVTDAMPTVGSGITEFMLNGRRVLRQQGRLTLEDGTLAGADLDMPQALRVLAEIGVPRDRALAMATRLPARLLHDDFGLGQFHIGRPLNAIHLDENGQFTGEI